MTLAPFVRIVAQGKGRARPLTQDEASAAMTLILDGQAAPEAIGALLMVLRLRGETDAEIAGFTQALRDHTRSDLPPADLDWPCYAAGRTRGAPLFLLAAKLVSQAGYHVAIHGWNSHQNPQADPRTALDALDLQDAQLTYSPLEALCPAAHDLLRLRDTFGLRSCINTVLRMWNPTSAKASVQGVFHPSYRGLQSRTAALLGDRQLTIIKGGGGEFERNPAKDIVLYGLRDGKELDHTAPALLPDTASRALDRPTRIKAVWDGNCDDIAARDTVLGTAALALWTLNAAPCTSSALQLATRLWEERLSPIRRTA